MQLSTGLTVLTWIFIIFAARCIYIAQTMLCQNFCLVSSLFVCLSVRRQYCVEAAKHIKLFTNIGSWYPTWNIIIAKCQLEFHHPQNGHKMRVGYGKYKKTDHVYNAVTASTCIDSSVITKHAKVHSTCSIWPNLASQHNSAATRELPVQFDSNRLMFDGVVGLKVGPQDHTSLCSFFLPFVQRCDLSPLHMVKLNWNKTLKHTETVSASLAYFSTRRNCFSVSVSGMFGRLK